VPRNNTRIRPARKVQASENESVREVWEKDEINPAINSQLTSKMKPQIRALVAPRPQAVDVILAGICRSPRTVINPGEKDRAVSARSSV
jgi:hypothetical protein